MLGDDLLVAPVVECGVTTRELDLPKGCWRHAGSDRTLKGPAMPTVDVQLDSLTYFTRCGTDPVGPGR